MPVNISLDVFPSSPSPRMTGYLPATVGSIRPAMLGLGGAESGAARRVRCYPVCGFRGRNKSDGESLSESNSRIEDGRGR